MHCIRLDTTTYETTTITQPLTEMSTRNRKIMFLGSKVQPVRRADKLATVCEQIV
jgi:hypothetical protein